jgi:hypothetical protein
MWRGLKPAAGLSSPELACGVRDGRGLFLNPHAGSPQPGFQARSFGGAARETWRGLEPAAGLSNPEVLEGGSP